MSDTNEWFAKKSREVAHEVLPKRVVTRCRPNWHEDACAHATEQIFVALKEAAALPKPTRKYREDEQ